MTRGKLPQAAVWDPNEWPTKWDLEKYAGKGLSDLEIAILAWYREKTELEPGRRERMEDGGTRFRKASDTAATLAFELRAKAQWEEKKCSRFGWPGSSRYKTDTKLGEQLRRDVAACYRWQGLDRNWPWRKFATLFYLSDKDFAIPEGEAAKDPDQLLRLALNFRTAADVWSNIAGNCAKEGRGRPTDTVLPKLVAFARKQGINLRGLAHVLAENRVLPSGRLATEIDDENLPASIEEQEVAWLARLRDCEKRQRRRRGKIPKSF